MRRPVQLFEERIFLKSFRGTLGSRDGLWIGWGMEGRSVDEEFWESWGKMNVGLVMGNVKRALTTHSPA